MEQTDKSLLLDDFYRSLFGTALEGVAVIGRDRRVKHINRALANTAGCCWWPAGVELPQLPRQREDNHCDTGLAADRIALGADKCGCGGDECSQRCQWCSAEQYGDCTDCPAYDSCVCGAAREVAGATFEAGAAITTRVPICFSINGRVRKVELAVRAAPLKQGVEELAIVIIENLVELRSAHLRAWAGETGMHGMVGQHPKMLQLFEAIVQVSHLTVPVVIEGESGTGKEMVARALHRESGRADRRLVAVNCGALAEGVLESELFGHVKGAFTGASRDRKGRFELADGGTIFLDEISELTPRMQVKLLRVLQDGTFERVGGEQTIKPDCRVLCATNRSLETEVARGRFREDLWYRLCVVTMTVPPLRERREDIPLLARHLLEKAANEFGSHGPEISPPALDALMGYGWPGNVRELENCLRHGLIRSDGRTLQTEHLPAPVRKAAATASKRRRGNLDPERIAQALRRAGGNKARAARQLGIGRATLYRHLASLSEEKGRRRQESRT